MCEIAPRLIMKRALELQINNQRELERDILLQCFRFLYLSKASSVPTAGQADNGYMPRRHATKSLPSRCTQDSALKRYCTSAWKTIGYSSAAEYEPSVQGWLYYPLSPKRYRKIVEALLRQVGNVSRNDEGSKAFL